jgi:hypothetical protein
VITLTTACRECHREGEHTLSCSHVRYEGRVDVQPADEVAAPHEPPQPYCPGPEVACYYGTAIIGDSPVCVQTSWECYYGTGAN